jgi:hypothetical protein
VSSEIPDDLNQVRQARLAQGQIEISGANAPSSDLIDFQSYLQSLAPVDVSVPFALRLAEQFGQNIVAPRILRDFAKLISLIKSVALIRHAHRKTDDKGRIVATIEDYRAVYGWVSDMYQGTTTGVSENVRKVVEAVAELANGPQPCSTTVSRVVEHLGCMAKSSVSRNV